MKKLVAIVLALVLALSLCVAAFAGQARPDERRRPREIDYGFDTIVIEEENPSTGAEVL